MDLLIFTMTTLNWCFQLSADSTSRPAACLAACPTSPPGGAQPLPVSEAVRGLRAAPSTVFPGTGASLSPADSSLNRCLPHPASAIAPQVRHFCCKKRPRPARPERRPASPATSSRPPAQKPHENQPGSTRQPHFALASWAPHPRQAPQRRGPPPAPPTAERHPRDTTAARGLLTSELTPRTLPPSV